MSRTGNRLNTPRQDLSIINLSSPTVALVDLTTPENRNSVGVRRSIRLLNARAAAAAVTAGPSMATRERQETAARNAIARMRRTRTQNEPAATTVRASRTSHRSSNVKTLKTSTGTKLPPKSPVVAKQLSCAVCFGDLFNASSISAPICGHIFCTSCITKTLDKYERCPLCGTKGEITDLRRIYLPMDSA